MNLASQTRMVMTDAQIISCYFPTTALLVDDNKRYLANMSLMLNSNTSYRLLDKPQQALDYLNQRSLANPFINRYLNRRSVIEKEIDSQQFTHINLEAIHKEIFSPLRFDEISVVLIDYAMPSMNGLEFCRALADSPIKKALVTGQADHTIAIQAFNDGIIDRFIVKDTPNFFNIINETISELQQAYFQHISRSILSTLPSSVSKCLHDPSFYELFQSLIQQHDIVEYYLLEASGSMLMLDKFAKPYWLIVKSGEDIETYYHIAVDNDAPEDICTALKNKHRIPFFYRESDYLTPTNEWNKFLHPANQLVGVETFYYALLEDPAAYPLENDKNILPYAEYLAKS